MGPTQPCLVLTNIHVWKYLEHHAQKPYHAPISSPDGKTPQNHGNPKYQISSTRERPYCLEILVHHSPLYKHQTSFFLRYTKILQLSHYRVFKDFSFTNLTLGGSLAGTTPVPSVCLICSYTQVPIGVNWSLQLTEDFSTSLVGTVYRKGVISHITVYKKKELHGQNAFNYYHQLGNRESIQRLGKTGANLGCNSGKTHPAQPRVGATTKPEERATLGRPTQRAGCQQAKCVRLNLFNLVLTLYRAKFACILAIRYPVFRCELCKGCV